MVLIKEAGWGCTVIAAVYREARGLPPGITLGGPPSVQDGGGGPIMTDG